MYAPRVLGHFVRHQRLFSTTVSRPADFTHAVVGAGAVGLAIARQLQSREGASVALIEKHGTVGTETSSRNSEVHNVINPKVSSALSYPIR
jgi:2-hydroxyglutarate dehydrogenase